MTVLQSDLDSRTFTWCARPLHMHRRILMSHNLVTEIKQKLTRSKIGKQLAIHCDQTSKITDCTSNLLQMQEPSPSFLWNPISIWNLAGGYMQGWKLTGTIGFTFRNVDESGSAAGSTLGMLDFDCGFTEPSLIWLLPGREVTCGLCDIPGTMSRLSNRSPNVAGGVARESSFVCGWMTAGTLISVVLYCLSHSRM
jgi:hypothetical protein